jgi:hypothetical protein
MWPEADWDIAYGITNKQGYLDNSPLTNLVSGLL